VCSTCGVTLPSKTQLFKHLKSGESSECTKVASQAGLDVAPLTEKVAVLFGHTACGTGPEPGCRRNDAAIIQALLACLPGAVGPVTLAARADIDSSGNLAALSLPKSALRDPAALVELANATLPDWISVLAVVGVDAKSVPVRSGLSCMFGVCARFCTVSGSAPVAS
jgi:hypothetical protein